MKAHQASCQHAQNIKILKPDDKCDNMATIVHFVENENKGNVTMAREGITFYKTVDGLITP